METDWVWILILAVVGGASVWLAEHITPISQWPRTKRALALGLIVGVAVFIMGLIRSNF